MKNLINFKTFGNAVDSVTVLFLSGMVVYVCVCLVSDLFK